MGARALKLGLTVRDVSFRIKSQSLLLMGWGSRLRVEDCRLGFRICPLDVALRIQGSATKRIILLFEVQI